MQEIKVLTDLHMSRTPFLQDEQPMQEQEQLIFVKKELAAHLANAIINRNDVFTRTESHYGVNYHAECYVLTPDDFKELVEQIKTDVQMGRASIIGGVS